MAQPQTLDADVGWRASSRMRGRTFVRNLYRLPPRVQALVDTESQRADILSAWIVFVAAAFLGVLYLVAPRALDVMHGVKPVPIVAALFLLSSLVRLRLAYRRPLSRMAQLAFIVADFACLYILIWSFHLQYDQPAAFYLKAPTFLFVFLLIAVRTLTFEPLAVIAAGLTAAAGWAVMGAYAVEYTPEPAVTRDFVAYITGNMVLIGAEVEKIVAILLVTGVLTLAIVRGRRQVVLAASETTARDHLSRFFAPEVAARITGDDEKVLKPGYGEVRRGAILISDLRNFTAFAAQRPPNEVMAVLVAYQRHVSHIVTEHGGAIDKFLGDGILATFGCARPSSTPARDAVQALMALLETSDGLARGMVGNKPETLGVGFAVTSGDVLCGTVGEESRLEFTVIGEPVNLAAKLEKANKGFDTVALADAALLVEAQREGLDISRLLPHEDLEVVLPGVPNARRVVAWKRQAPERE